MKKSCKKLHNVVTTNKVKSSNSKIIQQFQVNKDTTDALKNQRQSGVNSTTNANIGIIVKNNDESQSVRENNSPLNSGGMVGLEDLDVKLKGSFQGPIYYSGEIPEPNLRINIINSKISKLETYLSLCEELYLGGYSKSGSTSSLFQYLIISHNINSVERLESLSKKYQFTGNNKQNLKPSQKQTSNTEDAISAETIISPLDLLTHPFRIKDTIDLWGPHEVILFECAMCKYGKEFDKIQRIIKTKTTKEIVDFYYCVWKRTNRYRAWKENRHFSEHIFS
ncbi:hypothetical protein RS030_81352 [Cryptosporidium xiaoi]|uniref:SANT domain-containing protein n=1 Tax=Cryptosporidium xiaoi TaxID=659607 RepID=A0AAV9XSR7_9CRYT